MSASPHFTTPIVSLNRLGWIGLGDSRLFMVDALGGFFSLREQVAQEIGSEAEAEMVQRAGFASAERFVAAGLECGEISLDAFGFHKALSLLGLAGYGFIHATELRFEENFARVVVENSVEGWMFRESATRSGAACDYLRGMLSGIMYFMWTAAAADTAQACDAAAFESVENVLPSPSVGKEISCIETGCIAGGEECCSFVLGPPNLLLAEGLTPAPLAQSSVRETLLRLNRQLEQILDSSRKDPLTRLYNRSFFEAAMRQRIGYAKRRSDVVSLAIIDIDQFKNINDTNGHTVGDRVLRQISRCIEQQARENDVVARLGGDEFVWLMPATPGESALSVAERLRRMVNEIEPNLGLSVTVSIGVANYPVDASAPTELFEHADMALFAAKRGGRDQAVRYSASAGGASKRNNLSDTTKLSGPIAAVINVNSDPTQFAPAAVNDNHAHVQDIEPIKRTHAQPSSQPVSVGDFLANSGAFLDHGKLKRPYLRFGRTPSQRPSHNATDIATEAPVAEPKSSTRFKKVRY